MKNVIETIERELVELKPFYDEYVKLQTVLSLLKDETEVKEKPKIAVPSTKKRDRRGAEYMVALDAPFKFTHKYGVNPGDIIGNTKKISELLGVTGGAITAMKRNKYIVEVK